MSDSKSRNMSQTYRFDFFLVRMGPLSSEDDVCKSFKEILQLTMPELKSVDWKIAPSPTMCLVKISGYLHVEKASRLYETTVRTWILDERTIAIRFIGEIEWTPV